jgi:hypothetical protein
LADPIGYPISPSFVPGGNKVIGLSYDGASFHKNLEFVPFLRVYWSEAGDEVCLAEVIDVVNDQFQNTLHTMEDGCVSSVLQLEATEALQVLPNPMVDVATIQFPRGEWQLEVLDVQGRVVSSQSVVGSSAILRRESLTPGTYMVRVSGERATWTTKLNVH